MKGNMKMKLLNEMSTEEICALTEDQLDRRVKLECAEQGIPLIPEKPTLESFDIVRSETGYGISGTSFLFKDLNIAKEFLTLFEKHQAGIYKKTYSWQIGYDIEWMEKEELSLKIETTMFYNREVISSREDFLIKRKNIKDAYEKDLKDYESSREKFRKIADAVYSDFYEAKAKKKSIEDAKKTFSEYLLLADGDTARATVFFEKAMKSRLAEDVYNMAIAERTDQ